MLPLYDKLLPEAICNQLSRSEIESALHQLISIYAASWQLFVTKSQSSHDDDTGIPDVAGRMLCDTHRQMYQPRTISTLLEFHKNTLPTQEFKPYSELLYNMRVVHFADVAIGDDVTENLPNLRKIVISGGNEW